MGSEIEEHVTHKYDIKKRLGKGAYGIVWKAVDKNSGQVVALKKIFDAFRNKVDAQRTFREIMFLQDFGDHPNIVHLFNVLRAENDKDIYLVFEFMETDLHNVIKKGTILKDVHMRFIMHQLFKALKYLHSGNVIHRDLKPSNVLLNSNCQAKMCDFGLARSLTQIPVDDQGDPNLTEYVATRWYRAPEILLASHRYTKGVDQWSMGCILGEMFLGKALFQGSSTLNQLERIITVVDTPSLEDINSINPAYGSSVLQNASNKLRQPLAEMLSEAPLDGLHLLNALLQFNPDKRIDADHSLQHPYVKKFHRPSEEIVIGRDIVPPKDDAIQLSVEEYRSELYKMIHEKKLERRLRTAQIKAEIPPTRNIDDATEQYTKQNGYAQHQADVDSPDTVRDADSTLKRSQSLKSASKGRMKGSQMDVNNKSRSNSIAKNQILENGQHENEFNDHQLESGKNNIDSTKRGSLPENVDIKRIQQHNVHYSESKSNNVEKSYRFTNAIQQMPNDLKNIKSNIPIIINNYVVLNDHHSAESQENYTTHSSKKKKVPTATLR